MVYGNFMAWNYYDNDLSGIRTCMRIDCLQCSPIQTFGHRKHVKTRGTFTTPILWNRFLMANDLNKCFTIHQCSSLCPAGETLMKVAAAVQVIADLKWKVSQICVFVFHWRRTRFYPPNLLLIAWQRTDFHRPSSCNHPPTRHLRRYISFRW